MAYKRHPSFPQLPPAGLWQTSEPTQDYNCIAWAAEDQTRWWWPQIDSYWPPGVEREVTIAAFRKAYATLGYTDESSPDLDSTKVKIAIYAQGDSPTHAARQLDNGEWTSKLGRWIDASHQLRDLEGGPYGKVSLILSRPK